MFLYRYIRFLKKIILFEHIFRMPVYYLSTEFKGYEIVTLQTKPHILPKLVFSERYKICSPTILNRDQDNAVVPPH